MLNISLVFSFPIWDFGAGYVGDVIKGDFGFDYGDVSIFGVYAGDQACYSVIGIGPVKSHCYHHALFNQRKFPGQSFGGIANQFPTWLNHPIFSQHHRIVSTQGRKRHKLFCTCGIISHYVHQPKCYVCDRWTSRDNLCHAGQRSCQTCS